jgi:FtsX-like permease family
MLTMATVWLAPRADVRRKWRALLSLALLLGLAGGVVLTAAAGAQRTDTAYPRLLTWANASHVEVTPGEPDPAYFAALARLPQVAAVAPVNQYTVALPVPHGTPDTQVQALSSPNGTYGASVDRVKIVAGRMFSAAAADEAVIDPQLASMEHLKPGDILRVLGIPGNTSAGPNLKGALPLNFLVTAIAVFDDQVVPVTATNSLPLVLFSPGFTRTNAATKTFYLGEGGVRLRPGADPAAFIATAKAVEKKYPQAEGDFTVFTNLSDEITATERGIRPEAVALAVFAALAGLITLAVLGQLLARQLALDSAEFPILRAVGMTRRSLFALSAARLALVTVLGAILAVAIAVAASPLMPFGAAGRRAGPGRAGRRGHARHRLRGHRARAAGIARLAGRAGGEPRDGAARRGRAVRRADPAVPAGDRADVGRPREQRHRRADGPRAGTRPDRDPGAQRPGRQHRGHCRPGGRDRLRHQPGRAGRNAGPVRAELGRRAHHRLRRRPGPVRREGAVHNAWPHWIRRGEFRPAHRRRPDGARYRPRPGVRQRHPG